MQISRAFLRLSGRLTIDYKERKRLYPNKKSWCLSFNHETDTYLKNVGSIVEYPTERGKPLKKLLCCVGGGHNKIIRFRNMSGCYKEFLKLTLALRQSKRLYPNTKS